MRGHHIRVCDAFLAIIYALSQPGLALSHSLDLPYPLACFFLYGSKLVSGHPFPFVAVLFRCGGVGQPGTAVEGGFGA